MRPTFPKLKKQFAYQIAKLTDYYINYRKILSFSMNLLPSDCP